MKGLDEISKTEQSIIILANNHLLPKRRRKKFKSAEKLLFPKKGKILRMKNIKSIVCVVMEFVNKFIKYQASL